MCAETPTRHRHGLLAGLTLLAAVMPAAVLPQDAPALVVEEILDDSAAARVGIAAGDRVLSYDEKALPSPAALQAAEENTFGKADVVLRVLRGDETLVLSVPPGRLGIRARPALASGPLRLYEEGRAAQTAQKTDEVIVRWTAAAQAAQEAGGTAAAAWLHGRVGGIHESQRQWKAASDDHARAWELLKHSGDRAAASRTLIALGRCHQNLNDFSAARQWYEQARQMDEVSGNELWVARDLSSLGNMAWSRGDLPAAEDYFSRSLRMVERLAPGSLDVASSLSSLGVVTYRRGDLELAQDYQSRALALRERVEPESLSVADSLNNLGNVVSDRGDLTAAHEYHRRALAIRERRAPDSPAVGGSLNNLGLVAWSRGDLAAAQDYFNRALTLYARLELDSLSVANSLNNLGNVAHDRGDLQAAQEHQSRALAIRQRLAPHSLDVAMSLNNLGNAAYAGGALQTAQDFHSRALVIRERLAPDSLHVAFSLSTLGDIARDRGDLQTAQSHYAGALAIRERLSPGSLAVASSLNNLGQVAGDRGDLAGSQDYYGRALSIRERLAPISLKVASDLNGLGHVAFKQRRFSDALALYTRAVDLVEAQRWQVRATEARALLLAQHTDWYTGLLRTYVALDDLPGAFATAERTRARSLLEILTEARAEIREGVDAVLLERERLLQQQLNATASRQMRVLSGPHTDERAASVSKELEALLIQYQEVQAQIRIKNPRYAALTQPQPLALREIQQEVLDDNTVLLEYVLGGESSYVFAVTPTSIRSVALPARAEIERAARRVYELLTARQPVRGETPAARRARIDTADAAYPAAARALSEMVLGPVAAQLGKQRLLIVADGALQYVPFGALPKPAAPGSDEPLIVEHEIVSLPSASVAAVQRRQLRGREPAGKLVAVLADPVFDPEDSRLTRSSQARTTPPATASLPADLERAIRSGGLVDDRGSLSRLPFSRDEADAIIASAPAGQGMKAIDFNASRATATGADLGRYRIVHVATHGLVNTEHPELSGIVLSLVNEHGTPQDGFLRLHEIYNLKWSADLVVLSACQTGIGKEINGEGLVGLTRGFMYAGAERVMASLWSVNDNATAQLMKRFYHGVFARGLPPAAALRAAQVEMWTRKQWRPPYYWAAFVLQGEWK